MRVTVNLTDDERQALVTLARVERRDPRDQAAIEIRRALESAGLLAPVEGKLAGPTPTPSYEVQHV